MKHALALGLTLEEIYQQYGESQFQWAGLSESGFLVYERHVLNVRDMLLDEGIPHEIVDDFEFLAHVSVRRGDELPDGMDPETYSRALLVTGHRLSALMTAVRELLTPEVGDFYDVGIMAARLHLCLRWLVGRRHADGPQSDDPCLQVVSGYSKELDRVVPMTLGYVRAILSNPERVEAMESDARTRLVQLGAVLDRAETTAPAWREEALQRLDAFFTAVGAPPIKMLGPSAIPADPPGGKRPRWPWRR